MSQSRALLSGRGHSDLVLQCSVFLRTRGKGGAGGGGGRGGGGRGWGGEIGAEPRPGGVDLILSLQGTWDYGSRGWPMCRCCLGNRKSSFSPVPKSHGHGVRGLAV